MKHNDILYTISMIITIAWYVMTTYTISEEHRERHCINDTDDMIHYVVKTMHNHESLARKQHTRITLSDARALFFALELFIHAIGQLLDGVYVLYYLFVEHNYDYWEHADIIKNRIIIA
jgi:hypothetical protein